MRIGYRGQTLNSKSGYNRSGICRLVLEESKLENVEESRGQEIDIEEQQDPVGLRCKQKWQTNGKRRQSQIQDQKGKQRKKRKLQYETLPEDWGLDSGDLDRLEEDEARKTEFLKAGIENKLAGKAPKQMTIRTWSQTELWCRTLALQVIDLSSV